MCIADLLGAKHWTLKKKRNFLHINFYTSFVYPFRSLSLLCLSPPRFHHFRAENLPWKVSTEKFSLLRFPFQKVDSGHRRDSKFRGQDWRWGVQSEWALKVVLDRAVGVLD